MYREIGKYSKILNTFLFLISNKMLATRAGIHQMLVPIASTDASSDAARSDCAQFFSRLFLAGD